MRKVAVGVLLLLCVSSVRGDAQTANVACLSSDGP